MRRPGSRLPPAIRPGLHCGAVADVEGRAVAAGFPRPSGRGSIAATPARKVGSVRCTASPGHQAGAPLRPGLVWRRGGVQSPSPGHQAGAPLRRLGGVATSCPLFQLPPAIRPGLHCGGSALRCGDSGVCGFPRPSGRGSIAASSAALSSEHQSELPPAIRPGLHCGEVRPERCAMCRGTSPGHQAGAPLRQRPPIDPPGLAPGLPPAIRPGLHCGWSS